MLIKIAWRNIWRNRLRSLVVVAAVSLGLWAGVFMLAFSWGINDARMQNVIATRISHIQIHKPGFRADMQPGDVIPDGAEVLSGLRELPETKAISGRLILSGVAAYPRGMYGVQIQGIEPEDEAKVTQLKDRVVAGEYLDGKKARNKILLGRELMKKMGWVDEQDTTAAAYALGKDVVLQFTGPGGQSQALNFEVGGVYKSQDARQEAMTVYVRRSDLARNLGVGEELHEIALLMEDREKAEDTTLLNELRARYPEAEILNWKALAPDLRLMDESFGVTVTIFMSIILLALLFGIINTMLMAILERTRELGMLMSIGMNRLRVFGMVMFETIFLSLLGTPVGLLLGYLTVSYFGEAGIDVSAFAEGNAAFAISNVVYTDLAGQYYVQIAIMVFVTALIAAIFPARRALRLNPAEAVRAV